MNHFKLFNKVFGLLLLGLSGVALANVTSPGSPAIHANGGGYAGSAPALHWIVLGNGGGYAGGSPPGNPGPYFLDDPVYSCPAGSPAPAHPGYREEFRLDHWGPDGCAGQECRQMIFARQNSCGGPVTLTGLEPSESSEKYLVRNPQTKMNTYGFEVLSFEGQIYSIHPAVPHPAYPGYAKRVWCRQDAEVAGSRYEILIEERADGVGLQGTVYLADGSQPVVPPSPYFAYTLKQLTFEGVAFNKNPDGTNVYAAELAQLVVGTVPVAGQPHWTQGKLDLNVDGVSTQVDLRCLQPTAL